jgi:magnesium transporter
VIVDCGLYVEGARVGGQHDFEHAVKEAKSNPGAFVWVGMHEPSVTEFADLAREFDLHPLAVEDAVHAHQRPKLEVYGDTLFLVLKAARYVDHDEVVELAEIMLFVGRDFVVTVRHGHTATLTPVRRALEADPERLRCGPTAVLHAIVDSVVDHYDVVGADLDVDIDQIEVEVFSGDGRDHAERIFKLKREVLDFRRAVAPLINPLDDLVSGRLPVVDPTLGAWFRDVQDHAKRTADHLDTIDNLLDGVLSANLAQVGVRQNEDMRKISAWAAIAAVPTAIAGIYGMNFRHMPELETRYGYYVVLLLMVVACWWLYGNFKRRGWL